MQKGGVVVSLVEELLEDVARRAIAQLDLTGAFKADVTRAEIRTGCGDKIPPWVCGELMPSGVTAMCDACYDTTEPRAATIGLHVYKIDGYWTVERLRNGEVVEACVGALTIADALERIGDWMRREA